MTIQQSKLHSHDQWYMANKGRTERLNGNTEVQAAVVLHDLVNNFGHKYKDDIEKFFYPSYRGEEIPDMDGPLDDDETPTT